MSDSDYMTAVRKAIRAVRHREFEEFLEREKLEPTIPVGHPDYHLWQRFLRKQAGDKNAMRKYRCQVQGCIWERSGNGGI